MKKKNIIEMFVDGARDGWDIAIHSLMPNVILAFIIIKILDVTGFMIFISKVAAPVMSIFGLPGAAIVVNVSAFMSMGGACGVLASLLADGVINAKEATILLPAIFVCGGQFQNFGRVLGTSGVKTKYYGIIFGMSIVNGIIAMAVMSIIV